MSQVFSTKLETRKQRTNVFTILRGDDFQTGILLLAKLSLKCEHKEGHFRYAGPEKKIYLPFSIKALKYVLYKNRE